MTSTSTNTMTPALHKLVTDAETLGYPVVHDHYGFRIDHVYVATREDGTFGLAYMVHSCRTLRTIKSVRQTLRLDR